MIKPFLQDDAFLADVEAHREETGTVRVWWLGQSGFLVQTHAGHLLFDPYLSDSLTKKYANTEKPHVRMTERVVAPERLDFGINVITSTHGHTDHLDPETLKPIAQATVARFLPSLGPWCADDMTPCLVLPAATVEMARERLGDWWPIAPMRAWEHKNWGFDITAVPAAHPDLATNERGEHRYLGFVVQHRQFGIYHSGDSVLYNGMADGIRALGHIDLALLPINGKVGNMNGTDAARLAHEIGAKLVVPCHYEMFEFNTASPYELFVPECERLGQPYKVLRAGERLTLTK
jgi:L-ascorbate metabolism protein UlaG (beta-lactamase superfamily)